MTQTELVSDRQENLRDEPGVVAVEEASHRHGSHDEDQIGSKLRRVDPLPARSAGGAFSTSDDRGGTVSLCVRIDEGSRFHEMQ